MTDLHAFPDVKFQWISLVVQDKDLGEVAKVVAVYLITVMYHSEKGIAWPSQDRIAQDIGRSKRTVQRGIEELNGTWFDIKSGNGLSHSSEYSPTDKSHLAAHNLREKSDNVVDLHRPKGRQPRGQRVTNLSHKGRHQSPTNKVTQTSYKKEPPSRVDPASNRIQFFIKTGSFHAKRWDDFLESFHIDPLRQCLIAETHGEEIGYWLPQPMPPLEQEEREQCFELFLQIIQSQTNNLEVSHAP